MSTDEVQRKTVRLKIAKNGIQLYKNVSPDTKQNTKDISFNLKQFTELQNKIRFDLMKNEENEFKREQEELKREPEEETVLQKFIRGFDCGEFCQDNPPCYSANSFECPSTFVNPSLNINTDIFSDYQRKKIKHTSDITSPACRVEFISACDTKDRTMYKSQLKPLIVDLSQKKLSKDERCIKMSKASESDLKLLNRNFITPKVKVENFSSHMSESSNMPLIISPAETPNFQNGSLSEMPYPYASTKIEIDYTGSSIGENRFEQEFPRGVKTELSEMGASVPSKIMFAQENEFPVQENQEYFDEAAYQYFNHLQPPSHMGMGTSQKDILKAAKALYSKRTRTLFHWINPKIPKTKLKDSVMTAWDQLPSWQKQIYINQVIGKCSSDSVSPMVNPQILDMNGMAEAVLCASVNQSNEQNMILPPKKKRKYTRKASLGSVAKVSAISALAPGSSVYNFLSTL